ncbi:MAG TPA: SEC-C metal-binding domain-containing protein, partial [Chthoniobacterales bacterium]|nr:SEC-C metal-binding domain-containing protein [Chthoniobacterales bacterium]
MSLEMKVALAEATMRQADLRVIAAAMPEDDAELHNWIEETIANGESENFTFLTYAAALTGRKLSASLLTDGGLRLFSDDWGFARVAQHMEGDVMAALLQTTAADISPRRSAIVTLVAAAWWAKHRPGKPFPNKLLAAGRCLRHYDGITPEIMNIMGSVAAITEEAALAQAWGGTGAAVDRLREENRKFYLAYLDQPLAELIPETVTRGYSGERPMRRAVERFGRNEPCRCGSGKKYKRCCRAADQERLERSSDIAGVTWDEAQEDFACMTPEQVMKMPVAELEKLSVAGAPEKLQMTMLHRLARAECFAAVVEAYRELGVPEELRLVWEDALLCAAARWKRDAVMQLLAACPEAEARMAEFTPAVRLIAASDDAAKFCETLEAESLRLVKSHDSTGLRDLAAAVTASPYHALGILLARGALLLTESEHSTSIYDQILATRGELDLPPDDESADLLDLRAARGGQGEENAGLREAQAKLEAKAAEVRAVRERLAGMEREISLREKRESRATERPQANGHGDQVAGESVREMRAKMDRLKGLLQERGEERVTLRREVEKLHDELETLRSAGAHGAADAGSHDAEEAGEAVQVSGQQPVRLIEFPKKFGETLAGFPQQVGRAVMQHLGRIASGEPTAFMGLTKIYECDNVLRLRVAGDYRLLLGLWPDRVQVRDVV